MPRSVFHFWACIRILSVVIRGILMYGNVLWVLLTARVKFDTDSLHVQFGCCRWKLIEYIYDGPSLRYRSVGGCIF